LAKQAVISGSSGGVVVVPTAAQLAASAARKAAAAGQATKSGLNLGTRLGGLLQGIGGALISAGGAALGTATGATGVGAFAGGAVFVYGADVASTGFQQMITGETKTTLTHRAVSNGLQAAGVNEISAERSASIAEFGLGMVGGVNSIRTVAKTGPSKLVRPTSTKPANATNAGSEAIKEGEGVYDLGTTLGKYVGQSKDIIARVTSHFAKGGKLSSGELNNAVYHSMPGSTKLQREVYEHYLISEKYGIENLINVRLPMGGRLEQYHNMIDDVIKQFNLPR
jgi:hypothetical protein